MKRNLAEQEKDKSAALLLDLVTEFGEKYDFSVNSNQVVVTGKTAEVTSIYAEADEAVRDAGYTQTYYTSDTGRHGSACYLEDGRIQQTYYKKGTK